MKAAAKPRQWDIVEVAWIDAQGPTGAISLAEALKLEPILRKSVGYCLALTDNKIVIAETDDRAAEAENVCELASAIPTPWIQTVTVLVPRA